MTRVIRICSLACVVSGNSLLSAQEIALPQALEISVTVAQPPLVVSPPPSGEVAYLGEIVVTAQRMPQGLAETPDAVSVVSGEDMERANALDLGDAVRQATGVEITRYGTAGSVSSITIRGSRAGQVLVMQNGRPLNSSATGEANPSYLMTGPVERVEIVRGPSALLYGANALGGVVNAIMARPPAEPEAAFDAQAGGFGLQTLKGRLGGPAGRGRWLFSHEAVRTDGHRPNSGFKGNQSVISGELFDNPRFSVMGGVYDGELGVPGVEPAVDRVDRWASQTEFGNDDVASLVDTQSDRRAFMDSRIEAAPFEGHRLTVRHYLESNLLTMDYGAVDYDPLAFMPVNKMKVSEVKTDAQGVEAQVFSGPWCPENLNLTAGVSWRQDRLASSEESQEIVSGAYSEASLIGAAVETGAAYGEVRFRPAARLEGMCGLPRITLAAGARRDRHSRFGQVTNSHAGAVLSAGPLAVKGSVGSTFGAPTLNDLFWPADAYSEGNPALKPERGRIAEGSMELSGSGLLLRCGIYERLVKDQIDWAPDTVGIWRPENIGQVRTDGLEVESGFAGRWLKVTGTATTIHAVQSEPGEPDRLAAHVPNFTAGGEVSLFLDGDSTLTLSGRGSGTRRMYVGDKMKKISPYQVFSLRAARQLHRRLGVYAGVQNLADRRYSERFGNDLYDRDYPAPGRTYYVGANGRW